MNIILILVAFHRSVIIFDYLKGSGYFNVTSSISHTVLLYILMALIQYFNKIIYWRSGLNVKNLHPEVITKNWILISADLRHYFLIKDDIVSVSLQRNKYKVYPPPRDTNEQNIRKEKFIVLT